MISEIFTASLSQLRQIVPNTETTVQRMKLSSASSIYVSKILEWLEKVFHDSVISSMLL